MSPLISNCGISLLDLYRKYTVICSQDQRQRYKKDFNNEYKEYRDLHARINSVTQQFMELDTQLKQLHHESHKYKVIQCIFFAQNMATYNETRVVPLPKSPEMSSKIHAKLDF